MHYGNTAFSVLNQTLVKSKACSRIKMTIETMSSLDAELIVDHVNSLPVVPAK